MNSDIYLAVVMAAAAGIRRAAHDNIEPMKHSYYRHGQDRVGGQWFDLSIRLEPLARLQTGKDKKINPNLVALARNSVTLLCREAVQELVYDDREQVLNVRFYRGAVRFTRSAAVQRSVTIHEREYKADYFGLRDFALTEIEKETA